jgi:hypothetical protein
MAPANTADAWRQDGDHPDRSSAAARAPWPDRGTSAARSSRPVRTGPARPARPADRLRAAEARNRDAADFARTPSLRRGPDAARALVRPERGRIEARGPERGRFEDRRPEDRRPEDRRPEDRRPDDRRPEDRRPVDRPPVDRARSDERRPTARPSDPRKSSVSARPRPAKPATDGGRIRGVVAVGGMFLGTLAGAGVDSFVGIGLGLVTLVTLSVVTAVATLVVRRRDLISVVVAPPLVFVAVALVNIALAPSASFNLATIATLLVRGFPTMALPTGIAVVLGLIRWAARR